MRNTSDEPSASTSPGRGYVLLSEVLAQGRKKMMPALGARESFNSPKFVFSCDRSFGPAGKVKRTARRKLRTAFPFQIPTSVLN